MSKYVLIKTDYVLDDEITPSNGIAVLKRKHFKRITDDLIDFFKQYPDEEIVVAVYENKKSFTTVDDILHPLDCDQTNLTKKQAAIISDKIGSDYGPISILDIHSAMKTKLSEMPYSITTTCRGARVVINEKGEFNWSFDKN